MRPRSRQLAEELGAAVGDVVPLLEEQNPQSLRKVFDQFVHTLIGNDAKWYLPMDKEESP